MPYKRREHRISVLYLFTVLKQKDVFDHVMSRKTWDEVLSDEDRKHLQQFLPRQAKEEDGDAIITLVCVHL